MKRRLVAAAAVLTMTALAACSPADEGAAGADETVESEPAAEPMSASPTPSDPTPTPEPADDPNVFDIGEQLDIADSTLVVTSFEVVDEIETVDGGTMSADDGEQLVLFYTHFVNGSTQTADLSCSGAPDWYIQALDTEQREMAPMFDTYKIPGNPGCNDQLLSGQEADWNFAFRAVEGSTPMALQVTDSRTFDDFAVVDLTGEGLTVTDG